MISFTEVRLAVEHGRNVMLNRLSILVTVGLVFSASAFAEHAGHSLATSVGRAEATPGFSKSLALTRSYGVSNGFNQTTSSSSAAHSKFSLGNASYNSGWGNNSWGNTSSWNNGWGSNGWGNNGWGNNSSWGNGWGNNSYWGNGWGNSSWGNNGWNNNNWNYYGNGSLYSGYGSGSIFGLAATSGNPGIYGSSLYGSSLYGSSLYGAYGSSLYGGYGSTNCYGSGGYGYVAPIGTIPLASSSLYGSSLFGGYQSPVLSYGFGASVSSGLGSFGYSYGATVY